MRPPLCRWTGGGGRTASLLPCVDVARPPCSASRSKRCETAARGRFCGSAARLQPAVAQRLAELQLLLGRALLVRARRLEDHRQAVEARLTQEHRAPVLPE